MGAYIAQVCHYALNGINTQGENIADNGGVKEAFNAYKKWVKENGPEAGLPGLKYTPQQLFWISAANVWCGKSRPETLKLSILAGSHSPGRFRVIGPTSNTPEFAAEFNCPVGSPMNPVNKCTVW
ncbi:endothelin-converting enzyme, putative [Ixodes scapularis]|uniref:Endothelin-converting enzyme, putative n=1 Tax=Ixodes scapularis TaxID=6945 RepID=B7PUS9_IXOSC|nr:endothelin-converting enzyme, putative [Ixodes scapularis]|eukprot:XP_002406736.1 endothelin-converting enzyme, putative [Ixodes scapularis]